MHAPVAAKRDGWQTTIVDHASRAELLEKYASPGQFTINYDAIEEVDVIWRGGSLDQAVPADLLGSFDMLVASHVFEHLPDPIRFLASCAKVLKPDGVVSLAIPDYRFIFDYFRPWSTTGDVIGAYLSGNTRHTPAASFDNVAYLATADTVASWGQHAVHEFAFLSTLQQAYASARDAAEPGQYSDMHAWQLTPNRFALIMLELSVLGLIDWHIEKLYPTAGNEFIVHLRRGAEDVSDTKAVTERRLALLRAGLAEQYEQASFAGIGAVAEPLPSNADPQAIPAHTDPQQSELRKITQQLQTQHHEVMSALANGSIRGRLRRLRNWLSR